MKPVSAADSAADARIPYGLSADGRLLHVSQVPPGLACSCSCPACHAPLVARKGGVVAHYFAHHVDRACAGAWETALHLLAKQVVSEAREIVLPEAVAEAGGKRRRIAAARAFSYDSAEIEVDMDGLRPDAVVHRDGRSLLIEFSVTHPCGPDKTAEMRRRDLSCVEVDLSRVPRHASREEHAHAVLCGAPRRWIHNARVAAAEEGMSVEAERRAAEERARRARRHAGLAVAAAAAWQEPGQGGSPAWARWSADAGVGHLIGMPVPGSKLFLVDPAIWQAALLRWCHVTHRGAAFHTGEALKALQAERVLKPAFAGGTTWDPDFVALVRDLVPGFVTPAEAVEAYADDLVRRGALDPAPGGWRAGHERAWAMRGRVEAAQAARERETAVLARVAPLVETAAVPFRADRWMDAPVPELRASPAEVARAGGPAYDALLQRLDTLARMTRPGADPARAGLLGLPLEGLNRVRQQEAQVREQERARRLEDAERQATAKLLAAVAAEAAEAMGETAGRAWLAGALVELSGGSTPDLLSPPDRERVRQALARELRRREQEQHEEMRRLDAEAAAARLAQQCRDKLLPAVRLRFPGDRGEVWLRSTHPRLGRSPLAACTDKAGLTACLRLLDAAPRRR